MAIHRCAMANTIIGGTIAIAARVSDACDPICRSDMPLTTVLRSGAEGVATMGQRY